MFDKLVESEPQGADFKDRRRYFMVSSVVVGVLFTTAVVISIFAADYGLGSNSFELVEMLAPVEASPTDPEPEAPRPQTQSSSPSTSQLPSRRENIANIEEAPTAVPTTVSTVQNTHMQRPKYGDFQIRNFDSDPGNPGGTGREPTGTGPSGLTTSDPTKSTTTAAIEEETTPPPPVKKAPERKPPTPSLGVINGKASYLPKPTYSAAATAVKAGGKVDVQVTIDENGRVISAKAINGHPLLRAAAEDAAMRAKFTTTYLSNVPVKVTGIIAYNFLR